MTGLKETSCRLCLKTITDKGFQLIDNVTRDILDVLFLKLKFYGESKDVVCKDCRRKLNAAYIFKSTCLNTDKAITSYVNHEKTLQLDLGEIYAKENGSRHLLGISYNDKICRLCMQQIKSEIRCIGEEEVEAIHKFVPEMNIMIIKDPVVCKSCYDSLCTHNNFLKDCLEVGQRLADVFESSTAENQTDTSPSVLFIKTENFDEDYKIKEEDMSIKTECIDVKLEEGEKGSDMLLPCSTDETLENSYCKDANSNCNETENKTHFTVYSMKHKNIPNMYKCHTCDYKSKYKENVTRHHLTHRDPSQVQMYKCNDCHYKTIHKGGLARHILLHKDPTQVRMYKCDACDYESRHKHNFNSHQLKHKDPSEVQMYRCDDCEYKTIHKGILARHILIHKDPSQVQMYKCDACNLEFRYKNNLLNHELTHKDPSEVPMYKCKDCDYMTKFKFRIKIHALKHKDPSHTQMYKCDTCVFETKYRKNLIRHVSKHKIQSPIFKH